ncbi:MULTISPECIES: LysR family transcriptional regulator [Silvimonas]|uniref:LysR family transcriptional regulator n=2 Tax=Silvimonas TaxID=300264 RepID=A0ABQ2PA07_9NEIS|nr:MULTISPECIES: LysR family transcriptional regulator [Silvimonas]GGP21581.1 LysR family transcriptional regulator [Silvimonas iriomotensis]GGP26823.1 LysR family transcriptional regulator [Silvimonas amylolytica]
MLNRLEMLRIFIATAEASSFKEAAARLGISPQAVTRAIKELEQLQGELLFHRNTRNMRITSFGETLAGQARVSVGALDELFLRDKAEADFESSGLVRVAAPVGLGRLRLLDVLTALAVEHPRITFDLHLSDQHSDVVDEKIDIGVRFGFMRDNRFVARRVTSQRFHVVGTPDLIRQVGAPQDIGQLDTLPTTAFLDASTGRAWPWLFKGGIQCNPARPRFTVNDGEAECRAVLAGLAFAQMPSFLAEPYMASGELVPVLAELEPEPWDIYVYRPQKGPVPARIRLVHDRLVAALAGTSGVSGTEAAASP